MQDLISNCFTEGQVGEDFCMCFLGISVCSFRNPVENDKQTNTRKRASQAMVMVSHILTKVADWVCRKLTMNVNFNGIPISLQGG